MSEIGSYSGSCLISDLKPFNKTWRLKAMVLRKGNIQTSQDKNLNLMKCILVDVEVVKFGNSI